jgi:predicted transcriptional regulator
MKTPQELRSLRVATEIPAIMLAHKAGITRARLSYIEHGHVQPSEDEMLRLESALERLIRVNTVAREFVAYELAAKVGR